MLRCCRFKELQGETDNLERQPRKRTRSSPPFHDKRVLNYSAFRHPCSLPLVLTLCHSSSPCCPFFHPFSLGTSFSRCSFWGDLTPIDMERESGRGCCERPSRFGAPWACPLFRGYRLGPRSQVGQRPGVLVGEGTRICVRGGRAQGLQPPPCPPWRPVPEPFLPHPPGFPHQWLTGPAPLRAETRQVPPALPRFALRRLRSSGSAPRPPRQLHLSRLTGQRGSAPDAPAKWDVPTRPGHLSSRATSCRCQSARGR